MTDVMEILRYCWLKCTFDGFKLTLYFSNLHQQKQSRREEGNRTWRSVKQNNIIRKFCITEETQGQNIYMVSLIYHLHGCSKTALVCFKAFSVENKPNNEIKWSKK